MYFNLPLIQYRIRPVHQLLFVQLVPQMKVKNAELPDRILSMEDAIATVLLVVVDSATLLSVNLSVALSPIIMTITLPGMIVIVIGTTSK